MLLHSFKIDLNIKYSSFKSYFQMYLIPNDLMSNDINFTRFVSLQSTISICVCNVYLELYCNIYMTIYEFVSFECFN